MSGFCGGRSLCDMLYILVLCCVVFLFVVEYTVSMHSDDLFYL